MRSLAAISALAMLGLMTSAHAEITGTAAVTSDYVFRGVSLSEEDPAVQGSIDYTHDSGFYGSIWGSNIDYGSDYDGDIEIDLIAGFAGETGIGIGWDVGAVYYMYPDSNSTGSRDAIKDYGEAYLGGSYQMFDAKVWYADDYGDLGDDAWYTEVNSSFELPAGLTLGLHLGYSFGDYWDQLADDAGTNDGEIIDWSVGLGYTVNNFDLEVRYIDTETDSELEDDSGAFANDARVVFTVSTSFPWKE
jgi:uncharacterized protein (TIGR02001 family)